MALTRCFALALTAMMLLCAAVNAAKDEANGPPPTDKPPPTERPTEEDEASIHSAERSTSYNDPDANEQLHKEMEGSKEDKDDTVSLNGVTCTYSVMMPHVWADGDCCCPTIPRYYALQRFYRFGTWWYPLNNFGNRQWYKVGRCQSFGTCHVDKTTCRWTDKKCVQQFEWKGFFVYRLFPFQVRYMMLPVPDYCSCPHCAMWCSWNG